MIDTVLSICYCMKHIKYWSMAENAYNQINKYYILFLRVNFKIFVVLTHIIFIFWTLNKIKNKFKIYIYESNDEKKQFKV